MPISKKYGFLSQESLKDMRRLVSENIEELESYIPGKPIEELEREYGIKDSIKLASNENPLGPSPKALKAIINALDKLNRYPDGNCFYLKGKLSKKLGLTASNIIVGNGSNEIIELIVRTFMLPGDEAIMANPTFLIYSIVVNSIGGRAVKIPLKNFTHDLESISSAISDNTRVIFIANPNNPTGTIVRKQEFESFLKSVRDDIIIVLDEAYFEFVTDKSFPNSLDYLKGNKNIIALRTFSKSYGLAGLRIGFGIADAILIGYMNRVRQPFNVNFFAQIGALAALDDKEHIDKTVKNNIQGLKYFYNELDNMGYEYVPSQSNFLLINLMRNSKEVYEALLKKGVIVRPMEEYGLNQYIRVTVGRPEENERFVDTFKKVMSEEGKR